MAPASRTLSPPSLSLSDGTPKDETVGDIFFSPGKGMAEGETVFLKGNGLPRRWEQAKARHQPFRHFELGFGTGLNFLLTVQHFLAHAPVAARLDYWAVEAFPLAPHQRDAVWAQMPDSLSAWIEQLRALWPPPTRGIHPLSFHPRIRLVLVWDDGLAGLQGLAPPRDLQGGVDAWYLDGFAPSRAPALWQPELLQRAATLSNPGATAATFSAARAVRDALSEGGFSVTRVPGFDGKRHRVIARLPAPAIRPTSLPDVAIIGAGIAGVSAAWALRRAGASITLVDSSPPGTAASGNPIGLVTPRLALEDTAADQFFRAAWTTTQAFLRQVPAHLIVGRGALLPALDEKAVTRSRRLVETGALPPEELVWLDRETAAEAAGLDIGNPALLAPQAAVLRPAALTQWLARDLPHQRISVSGLSKTSDGWRLLDRRGTPILESGVIVLANSIACQILLPEAHLPLVGRLGQITQVAATPPSRRLRVALSGNGYVSPAIDGAHTLGATFDPFTVADLDPLRPTARDDDRNRLQLGESHPDLAAKLGGRAAKVIHHRRAVRATTPDRLPMVGPVADTDTFREVHEGAARSGQHGDLNDPSGLVKGLFVLTGLGARGFLAAPLAAEILAAQITGDLIPAPASVATVLHPARFHWRALKRHR